MQHQRPMPDLRRPDFFLPELERLRSTATVTINEHLNDAGFCAICGSAWPSVYSSPSTTLPSCDRP